MNKPDSLIFDMDGTLWDAADSYLEAWNEGARIEKIGRTFTRADLDHVMGWERGRVLPHLLPDNTPEERDRIYATINRCRDEIIPRSGGIMYPGVVEGMQRLASKYKLFIVSNCPTGLIVKFMDWSKLTDCITDEMAHGVNLMPKYHNIGLLRQKHGLVNPVYIGDTHGDSVDSRKAGIPFVFVSYGFGSTEDYDIKFDDFTSLTRYFEDLAER